MQPKTFKLSKRSLSRLEGVHPDLVAVIKLAIKNTPVDFTVLEGLRTKERQKQLFASGASKTMNSRHLTGHAVDIAPYVDGQVSWDWPLYYKLAPAVKAAAAELNVPIEWGGNWTTFKDGPHWQLPWADYDKDDMKPRFTPLEAPKPDYVAPDPAEAPQGLWAALLAALMGLFGWK